MSRRFPLLLGCLTAALALTTVSQAARPTKRLSDEARGEQLYDRHCIQCHGENGAGDGPLTPSLVKPVPDLRELLVEANRERFVPVVMDGRASMPAFRNSFDRYDGERVMRHMERIAVPGYERPSTVTPKAPEPKTAVPAPSTPPAPAVPPPPPPKADPP
ncbi:MAG: cytochrome c [Proteobacteria bacterium]|nr:cytochrome c [Pseudomonadota bacterium]